MIVCPFTNDQAGIESVTLMLSPLKSPWRRFRHWRPSEAAVVEGETGPNRAESLKEFPGTSLSQQPVGHDSNRKALENGLLTLAKAIRRRRFLRETDLRATN